MSPDELLKSWFENVWNQRSDEFVHRHMGQPCCIEGLPESACCPEGFIEFRNGLQAAVSNMHIEVLDSMKEGDRTIGTCRVTGVHTASGEAVNFCFGYTSRVEGDKIVEAHNIVDFFTMLQQAKMLPADSLEKGLLPVS